jgi:hypothetical protein
VRAQLVELCVPAGHDAHEAAVLRRAIEKMPQLRRLELVGVSRHAIERDELEVVEVTAPWPRWNAPTASEPLWARCANDRGSFGLSPRALLKHCERSYRWFDATARAAWAEVWVVIGSLSYDSGSQRLPSTTLLTALEALGFLNASFEELRPWSALRERLRDLDRESDVLVSRQRSFA